MSEHVKMVVSTGLLLKNVIKHDLIFHSNSAENYFRFVKIRLLIGVHFLLGDNLMIFAS